MFSCFLQVLIGLISTFFHVEFVLHDAGPALAM